MKNILLLLLLMSSQFSFSQNDTITVYFNFDSYVLSDEEFEKTLPLRTYSHTPAPIRIEAHTDTTGSELYNKALAKKRVDWVRSRINVSEDKAFVIGERQANTSKNYSDARFRRVDIITPPLPITTPSVVEVIPEDTQKLSDGISEFINSEEDELSYDLSIHFQPGTASPLQSSYPQLNELARILKDNENLDAFLHGHVCCSDNLPISEARAEFVFRYLVQKGIDSNRLEHSGHGNSEPKKFPERTENDRIQNRRVNVVFTK